MTAAILVCGFVGYMVLFEAAGDFTLKSSRAFSDARVTGMVNFFVAVDSGSMNVVCLSRLAACDNGLGRVKRK